MRIYSGNSGKSGIDVPIGAPLQPEEIDRYLDEGDRAEALKEHNVALEQAEEARIRAFHKNIANKYMSRNFSGIISDIEFTDIKISGNLRELVIIALLIYLKESISNERDAQKVIYAINKIGEKLHESPWKEKMQVRIRAEDKIIPLVDMLIGRWDNNKLAQVICNWELTQGISERILTAREKMKMPINSEEALEKADKFLRDGKYKRAIEIYIKLWDMKFDINSDRKDRKGIIDVYSVRSEEYNAKNVEKAAIKAGIIPKPKKRWQFWR